MNMQLMQNISLELLYENARSITFEIKDGGIYHTQESYEIYVNHKFWKKTQTVITSLYGLKPMTFYLIEVKIKNLVMASMEITTSYESQTLDVGEFGAVGDGINDDTIYIQAAIMACPKDGRVLIPKGTYLIRSLFLKSHIKIELEKESILLADNNRSHYPVFPGMLQSYDEKSEYNLGTWEGNPLPMFSGIITGIDVEDVQIYGEGILDGNAGKDNWWHNPKVMRTAFRPRMIFLNRCRQITLQGFTLQNSPSWVIHPYFSKDLKFYQLSILNPADSPNTDGLDPESCENVDIQGVHFSLGDDCIAIKSGKIYMGKTFQQPCRNLRIRQCFMENGHGAITMGSEMAGGILDVHVESCLFQNTDRGLRVKTRRGRGKHAIIDQIHFQNIRMNHVKTPFVVNCFYFCDPDGKMPYAQSREYHEVDERTPEIKTLIFEDIRCDNCHVAATYFEGLPEKKIGHIIMKHVQIAFADQVISDVPAMSLGVETCVRKGLIAKNVALLEMKNVMIKGYQGEMELFSQVDQVIR